ncbi:MAG: protein kinase [Chthoniobacteraceae bacterium]
MNQRCPQCGAELPGETPEGLCPACLLQRGLETRTAGTGGAPEVPSPTPEALAGYFPQLEIVELLGRGGMGAVYKARHKGLDRWVALKILPATTHRNPSFAERFSREARALARLDHPNIVTVYDSGEVNGLYFFIMEYVDGANLRQVLTSGKMSPAQALAIVPQICDALQYAHDKGIVHRDIKPENILIDKAGRVKIADFGIAKIMGREARDFTLTSTEDVMGTPAYMAPEQVEHPSEVDHRADIFSLGVVFYQMLTGELPLGRFAPPSRKVHIDVRLDEVVLRALEKEPERRYQQAGEVKTEVETIAGTPRAGEGNSRSDASAPEAPTPDARQPWRRRFWPPLVGQRNGQRVINWPTVAMCCLRGLLVLLILCIAFNGVIINSNERFLSTWSYFEVGVILLSLILAIQLLRGFALPLAQLAILDKSASGRSKTWILSIAMICAVLAALRLFVLAPYRIPTDAALPEIPRGSLLLVFKLGRNFVPGDFVAYRQGREVWVARVAQAPAHGVLQIARHNEPLQEIPVSSVIGKVILNTRPERLGAAAAHPWIMSDNIINEIQPDGTIRMKSTLEKVNLTGETVTRDRLVSSRLFGNPPKVLDTQGRPMAVEVKPLKDYYEWWVTLNDPVRPGGIISWVFPEATVTGEIRKVSDFGLYEYSMKHWPAVSGFTRYGTLYRLPVGAKLVEKYPPEVTEEFKDGRTELHLDQMIPSGGSVEIRFRYQLPPLSLDTSSTSSKTLSFGPVIEQTVTGAIDFDTGKLITPPKSVSDENDIGKFVIGLYKWMEQQGLDVYISNGPDIEAVDMKVAVLSNAAWATITVEQLSQALESAKNDRVQPLNHGKDAPLTYAFQTREGGMGILQFLGFNDKDGANLRYKLVHNVAELQNGKKPDGTLRTRSVAPGVTDNGAINIESGISPEEIVATVPGLHMDEGTKVRYKLPQANATQIVQRAVETISQCSEGDPRVTEAMRTLKPLDSAQVVSALVPFLDSSIATVRRSAIYILYVGGLKSIEPAIAPLEKLLTNPEDLTRGMAALALGTNKVADSFDALVLMAKNDTSGYARRCAVYALGLLGNEQAIPVLKAAQNDSDPTVRQNAQNALNLLERAPANTQKTPGDATHQNAVPPQPSPDMKNRAVAFVDLLAKGDFAKARSEFDATMSGAMSEQMLGNVWAQLGSGGGKYLGHGAPRQETFQGYIITYVPCRWERMQVDLKIVYNRAGKVSGLWVVPAGSSMLGNSPTPSPQPEQK